jgi:ATP-dependent DNA helicase RecG
VGLSFEPSPSQRAAVEDVLADLERAHPMARLVAGEVGSGKTAVGFAAIEEVRSRGLQCAFLAPTELLARQHYRWACTHLPRKEQGVALLTGTLPEEEVRQTRLRLATGEAELVVGTHALLSKATSFARLGLVVIDEEQRFGVEQREALLAKATTPHSLVLTATPIPRSLALLSFGDCDLSVLSPRADARGEVITRIVSRAKRGRCLEWVREKLREGQQAFFVRPRIEGETGGAVALFEELRAGPCAGIALGLVHGRQDPSERNRTLEAFQAGRIAAIVTTTIVEVGLDVPGATILWIEEAERLGLSQLHQLRGRIARRGQRGYCWVVDRDEGEGKTQRLRALVEVDDGMRLAEIDLELRGFGELLGSRQSGHLGPFGRGTPALAPIVEKACRGAALLLEREAEVAVSQHPLRRRGSCRAGPNS